MNQFTHASLSLVHAAIIRADCQFVVLVEHRSGRLPLRETDGGMQVTGAPPLTWVGADGLVETADTSFLDEKQALLLRKQWETEGVLLYQVGEFKLDDPLSDPVGFFLSSPGE